MYLPFKMACEGEGSVEKLNLVKIIIIKKKKASMKYLVSYTVFLKKLHPCKGGDPERNCIHVKVGISREIASMIGLVFLEKLYIWNGGYS